MPAIFCHIMLQSYGWDLKLVPLLESCGEGSEVTRYLPSHRCPAGDAVYLTVCFTDSWVSCSKSSTQPPVRPFLDLSGFQGRGEKMNSHQKTSLEKALLWSLWIYIWVLKMCSPVQLYYSFIHTFSIFTRGHWELMSWRRLSRTEKHIPTHTCEQSSAVSSPDVFLRMRGNRSTRRKPAHGSAREALKRMWIWPLLSVNELRKPEAHIPVSSPTPINCDCNLLRLLSCISILFLRKTHNNNEHMSIFSKWTFSHTMLSWMRSPEIVCVRLRDEHWSEWPSSTFQCN